MNGVLFSVIVPIYNVELYIRQCVDSILAQTYKNFELILVDDGSPDACPQICDEYAAVDERVKVIHKVNGGLVSARKAGAETSVGEYVVCVDGDDWIALDYLEKSEEILRKYSPDIICFGHYKTDGYSFTEKNLPNRKGFYDKKDIKNEIFPLLIQNEYAEYFSPSVWAKVFNAELYKRIQATVDKRIKIGEDGACTIPCVYNAQSIYISDFVEYYYRENRASMTKEKKAFPWDGPLLIHKQLEQSIDMTECDFCEQLYRKTAHELFTVVVSQFNRNESYNIIKADIKKWIKVYDECVKNARFKGIKGMCALNFIKYNLVWGIKLFSVIKK